MNEPKRPRGRPRVDESLRKRTVSITLRGPLRAALEKAAAAADRSLSAEIEFRVEESALLRGLMPDFTRQHRFLQMAVFLQTIDTFEEETGKPWDEDEAMVGALVARVTGALLNIRRIALGLKIERAAVEALIAEEQERHDG